MREKNPVPLQEKFRKEQTTHREKELVEGSMWKEKCFPYFSSVFSIRKSREVMEIGQSTSNLLMTKQSFLEKIHPPSYRHGNTPGSLPARDAGETVPSLLEALRARQSLRRTSVPCSATRAPRKTPASYERGPVLLDAAALFLSASDQASCFLELRILQEEFCHLYRWWDRSFSFSGEKHRL